jgi:hypothetical protein
MPMYTLLYTHYTGLVCSVYSDGHPFQNDGLIYAISYNLFFFFCTKSMGPLGPLGP